MIRPRQSVGPTKFGPSDGFQQVLEMLQVSDKDFRDALLIRLAIRDPELAKQLVADLEKVGVR